MDYVNVGANGFAQLGDSSYYEKNKVEMKFLLEFLLKEFPIPTALVGMCRYAVKAFPHDFGTYHEIVVQYDDHEIIEEEKEELDESEIFFTPDEFWARVDAGRITPVYKLPTLYESFWNWFNKVEMYDLETEEITEQIKSLYYNTLNMEKGEHLEIVA